MKIMVSGHRKHKLLGYDAEWIQAAMETVLLQAANSTTKVLGFCGMASGVDLWFCALCERHEIPFVACVPFDEQAQTIEPADAELRQRLLAQACEIRKVRNRWIVEHCDKAIVVWDGTKGGTHNVLQQLIEARKDFWWLNPVKKKIIEA